MSVQLQLRLAALCVVALCCGCESIDSKGTDSPLIPNEQLNISRSLSFTLESLVAGAALFVIIDPLAPNWRIEQSRLDGDRYLIAMKKKRFTTGGDGEAAQIFSRRAEQLAREHGNGRYRLVGFTEGIESSVPFAQRVAHGIVEVEGAQPMAQPRNTGNDVRK
jgi:hypothetical protein